MSEIKYPKKANRIYLRNAENEIESIRLRLNRIKGLRKINDEQFEQVFEGTCRQLFKISNLSIDVFNIQEDLQKKYNSLYPDDPKKAKMFFNMEYTELHKMYDILKNRCYAILEDLDLTYEKFNKRKPPNIMDNIY